jgi:hypothetical protein
VSIGTVTAAYQDDIRHFGTILQDPDFPELEGTAFSQINKLPAFAKQRARTLGTERETTEATGQDEAVNWFSFQVVAQQWLRKFVF